MDNVEITVVLLIIKVMLRVFKQKIIRDIYKIVNHCHFAIYRD